MAFSYDISTRSLNSTFTFTCIFIRARHTGAWIFLHGNKNHQSIERRVAQLQRANKQVWAKLASFWYDEPKYWCESNQPGIPIRQPFSRGVVCKFFFTIEGGFRSSTISTRSLISMVFFHLHPKTSTTMSFSSGNGGIDCIWLDKTLGRWWICMTSVVAAKWTIKFKLTKSRFYWCLNQFYLFGIYKIKSQGFYCAQVVLIWHFQSHLQTTSYQFIWPITPFWLNQFTSWCVKFFSKPYGEKYIFSG